MPTIPVTKGYNSTKLLGYNLDELQRAWALHFQDSYRIRTEPDIELSACGGTSPARITTLRAVITMPILPRFLVHPGINNLFNPGSSERDDESAGHAASAALQQLERESSACVWRRLEPTRWRWLARKAAGR